VQHDQGPAGVIMHTHTHTREIMLFIGKPIGRSIMINMESAFGVKTGRVLSRATNGPGCKQSLCESSLHTGWQPPPVLVNAY